MLASDCVTCLSSYSIAAYSCRFCGDKCRYKNHGECEGGNVISGNSTVCLEKNTKIEKVVPAWSPGEGGVEITLFGKSLSVNGLTVQVEFLFEDPKSKSVETIACHDTTYTNSTSAATRYHPNLTPPPFQPLDIDEVFPDHGPVSGGTRIRVNGTRLCVHEQTGVTINGKTCTNVTCNTATQELHCTTPANPMGTPRQPIAVTLGGATVEKDVFQYGADPVVTKVTPNCTLAQGGTNITVTGKDFYRIQNPRLVLTDETCSDPGIVMVPAMVKSNERLVFTIPQDTTRTKLGFKMDNVKSVCETNKLWALEVLPRPTVITSAFMDGTNKSMRCFIGENCTISVQMTQIHRICHHTFFTTSCAGSDRIFGSVRWFGVFSAVRFGSVENFDRTTEFFFQKMARNRAFSAIIFRLFHENFYGFHCQFCHMVNVFCLASSQHHGECEGGNVISGNSTVCLEKNTKIEKVIPAWSPGEGGVEITLFGKSLSVNGLTVQVEFLFEDSKSKSVNTIACHDTTYTNSTRVTCKTPSIMEAHSFKEMHREPLDIDEVFPDHGPVSGGTRIRVNGTRLCVHEQTGVTINGKTCTNVTCNTATQELHCTTPANPMGTPRQPIAVTLGGTTVEKDVFQYGADPVVTKVTPNCTLAQGGTNITVTGKDFYRIQNPRLVLTDETCSDPGIVMVPAMVKSNERLVFTIPQDTTRTKLGFKMDNVKSVCETNKLWALEVLPRPTVITSAFMDGTNKSMRCFIGENCTISVQMTQIHRLPDQVTVLIGSSALCANMSITQMQTDPAEGILYAFGQLKCSSPSLDKVKGSVYQLGGRTKRALLGDQETDRFSVVVQIGHYEEELGTIVFVERGFKWIYAYIAAGAIGMVLMVFMLVIVVKTRNEQHKRSLLQQNHEKELTAIEVRWQGEAKKQFVMNMIDRDEGTESFKVDPRDIPFRVFRDYLIHCIFPSVDTRKILNNLQYKMTVQDINPFIFPQLEHTEYPDEQLSRFKQFLNDEHFVQTFISVIEAQRDFLVR
eukprot:sb/3461563/